jgi:histidine triad (HIT) family protein
LAGLPAVCACSGCPRHQSPFPANGKWKKAPDRFIIVSIPHHRVNSRMKYDPNNIFAKILRGEVPSVKVYEDEHTLVVPKEHATDIFDLSPDAASRLIKTTQKIARAVKKAMDAPGVMLAQLNGAAAGQSVFHVHFHVIPRSGGVDMKLHAREMENPDKLKAVAEKIKAALEKQN